MPPASRPGSVSSVREIDANCAYISYFNLPGTTGTNSRLLTSSSATTSAFKAVAASHNAGWRNRR